MYGVGRISQTGLTTAPEPQPDSEGGADTVLVVDDDGLSARATVEQVRALGYRAHTANQWAALREIQAGEIDLVLMDAVMPTVDGFKLTRLIREQTSTYVPIVFLTGLGDADARGRCVDAGADDLLSKPVDPLELATRLKAMLRIRRLTQNLEQKRRELDELARRDALTGLFNRRALDERLPAELTRARRYGRPLAVVMADIDYFKRVNDEQGHAEGDRVLQLFSERARGGMRAADLVYRSGGEEFVLVLTETEAGGAVVVANRVRVRFAASRSRSGKGGRTASFGVATLAMLGDDANVSALLSAADQAMYAAKQAGRNRVVRWDQRAPAQ